MWYHVVFMHIYYIGSELYHIKKYLQKLIHGISYSVNCMSILIMEVLYDTGYSTGFAGFT